MKNILQYILMPIIFVLMFIIMLFILLLNLFAYFIYDVKAELEVKEIKKNDTNNKR